MGNKIIVKVDGVNTQVYIDGIQLKGVYGVEFSESVDAIPVMEFKMYALDTEIQMECTDRVDIHIENMEDKK